MTIERLLGAMPALWLAFGVLVLIVLMAKETRRENRERKRKEDRSS